MGVVRLGVRTRGFAQCIRQYLTVVSVWWRCGLQGNDAGVGCREMMLVWIAIRVAQGWDSTRAIHRAILGFGGTCSP